MPALANPRHERFARCIVAGLTGERYSQGRAYVAAGYNAKDAGKAGGSAEVAASRLLKKVQPILARVSELQAEAAKAARVTVESIVGELEEARAIAAKVEQPSAMVAASAAKAKVLGLTVERHEHGQAGDFASATSTNDLADAMLREANPGLLMVSEAMRESALAELSRHAAAMAAIASGQGLETSH